MKKRAISLIMVIVLLLGIAGNAFAAPGDKTIFTQEGLADFLGSEHTNIEDVAVEGDQLYILFQTRLYHYQLGAEEPVFLLEFAPLEAEGRLGSYLSIEDVKKQLDGEVEGLIHQLFIWQEQLYGLNKYTGKAFPIDLEKKEIRFDQPLSVENLYPIEEGEDADEIRFEGLIGTKLYYVMESYGSMYQEGTLFSIDLQSQERKAYNDKTIKKVIPYKENLLLAVTQDHTSDDNRPKLEVLNPETQEREPYLSFEGYDVGGVVYNQEEDAVYYAFSSKVMKQQKDQPAEEVGFLNLGNMSTSEANAWLTEDLVYIINARWGGIVAKNLDPQYKPTTTLNIYGGGWGDTIRYFNEKYPDVPVIDMDW
ncbi:MAG: hypothetical protein GX786_08950, partial [Clostridiales bacterium]|nr:hypothetical protein [Clostridiales bacterium]